MRTFWIDTLGCKVNQYESEQLATLLQSLGLTPAADASHACLRVVNSCSVTVQAASKSRQTARQHIRLPVLRAGEPSGSFANHAARVLLIGCWATSNSHEARKIPGVSAVITHHDDVASDVIRLVSLWQSEDAMPPATKHVNPNTLTPERHPEPAGDNGWINKARTQVPSTDNIKTRASSQVKENLKRFLQHHEDSGVEPRWSSPADPGARNQRAFLKIQDGCDAHCTYCIIPRLRSRLWSKPLDDVVAEARQLVAAGHRELVLTGIFLSAYGQPTALRRRQRQPSQLPSLIHRLCSDVPGLLRLRLSSLEPGDLTDDLLLALRTHPQVVPHFHLPLQSGSDRLLRRMNRQYTRDDFLQMLDRLRESFDRPALTTDIIVGFPGETDEDFQRTLEVVDAARFIHIHAFHFSPRPGTAAARWQRDFVHGPVVNQRLDLLRDRAAQYSLDFRRQFVGHEATVLVERGGDGTLRHGRCERYFDIWFEGSPDLTGAAVRVRIDRASPDRTIGTSIESP